MAMNKSVLTGLISGFLCAGATALLAQALPLQLPPTPSPTPAATGVPPQVTTGPPADYTFSSGAGLLFFHVTPAKVADFELIIGRIHEALTRADTPTLKQQALNWKIYRSIEPSTDAKVYVFAFDPALTTASYDPLLLLAQVLPQEVQPLYERLKADVIKIERMGLETIR